MITPRKKFSFSKSFFTFLWENGPGEVMNKIKIPSAVFIVYLLE